MREHGTSWHGSDYRAIGQADIVRFVMPVMRAAIARCRPNLETAMEVLTEHDFQI